MVNLKDGHMFGVRARRSCALGLPGNTSPRGALNVGPTPGAAPTPYTGLGGIRPLRALPASPDLLPKLHLGTLEGRVG